ncbi:MAG: ribonuclease Y [bacterium]
MDISALVVGLLCGAMAGAAGGYLWCHFGNRRRVSQKEDEAHKVLEKAQQQSDEKLKEATLRANDEYNRRKQEFEKELGERRREIERIERKALGKEANLDRKYEQIERRDKNLTEKERQIEEKLKAAEERQKDLDKAHQEAIRRCEEVSGLTAEQAKKMLLESLETDLKQESAAMIRRVEAETKEIAAKKARQIVTLAIQKTATDQVSESTVSMVSLPSDDLKGRIIGREGRNIRSLEAATGVNIIVDDTPEAIVLSCFDPMRREIARQTLERLLSDGRIHPARIEEVVQKVEKEVHEKIREAGEQACFDLGIQNVHPELVKLLGRLKYRSSYGQNVLLHVQEVAHLCEVMASELGVDAQTAKRAGLLHDIGKAVTYEVEGTHAQIGSELLRKYGESPAVIHAVAAHHYEEEPRTIIAVLVISADAISAARPGARREALETYVKRLEKLEEIAASFDGVAKAYALQAGRELRIMVEPEELNDNDCAKLARDITKRIEGELQYPGQIKVTVVRETRAVEYAK